MLAAAMAASVAGCSQQNGCPSTAEAAAPAPEKSAALAFDSAKWSYDADNDVYWQVGISYCSTPQAEDYESMGIYVPGANMEATANADGTYTCTPSKTGQVCGYTAKTAPVVIPVNTPGYASAHAPTEYRYDSLADYLTAGFVYLQPGLRGRSSMKGEVTNESYSGGAPWGVTDLKAAIRYYRLNRSLLPGDADNLYTFGMSGGGAQSALAGATGDSSLYTPYLEAIGAAMTDAAGNPLSDAVTGAMCWCPITGLDEADAAYEWNMGQFATGDSRAETSFGSALSKDLAASYAQYINSLGLMDGNTALTLTESDEGIYQAGSYYDLLLSVVQTSLNNFLADTSFPYTEVQMAQFPGGSNGNSGADSGAGGPPEEQQTADTAAAASRPAPGSAPGAGPGAMAGDAANTESTTYATVEAYIDSLNTDSAWVRYDAAANTATITSLAAFVAHCKQAAKGLGAFDVVDRGQGENNLFGNGQGNSSHFDATLAKLLTENAAAYAEFSDWQASCPADFASDLAQTDELGTSVQTRVDMYNPMYFLCSCYAGCGTSTVAKYWRIRTGAFQPDTALTVETNLALALKNTASVSDVDFATVWGMKHVLAERTGTDTGTANFVQWVKACASGQTTQKTA